MSDFFAALFDLSFTNFVTTKLIKILYVITLALLVLGYLMIGLSALAGDQAGVGILWLLIIGPVLLFFYTLLYRVVFEIIVVIFRIFENSRDELALQREIHPEAAAAVASAAAPQPYEGQPQPPLATHASTPSSEAPTQVQAGSVCTACGAVVNPGDRFCQSCGSAIDQTN